MRPDPAAASGFLPMVDGAGISVVLEHTKQYGTRLMLWTAVVIASHTFCGKASDRFACGNDLLKHRSRTRTMAH